MVLTQHCLRWTRSVTRWLHFTTSSTNIQSIRQLNSTVGSLLPAPFFSAVGIWMMHGMHCLLIKAGLFWITPWATHLITCPNTPSSFSVWYVHARSTHCTHSTNTNTRPEHTPWGRYGETIAFCVQNIATIYLMSKFGVTAAAKRRVRKAIRAFYTHSLCSLLHRIRI